MKLTKKFIVIVFTFVLLIGLIACGNTNENQNNSEKKLKYLVLGDSIAEAVLGPSPLSERDNYSYCSIIGKINGYEYHNRAVSGHLTGDLANFLERSDDETAYTPISLVKEADIIQISIIGNDLLHYSNSIAIAVSEGDSSKTEAAFNKAYNNIDRVVKRIRSLNKDVTLLIQTLYNPYLEGTDLFTKETVETVKNNGGDIEFECRQLVNQVNNVFYRYLIDNPGAFYIVDVYNQFELSRERIGINRLMFPDDVHPSNEGHANIVSITQATLEKLGLAKDTSALKNYKNLRIEQLNRLYKDTKVDVKKIEKAIKAASSFDEINDAYFTDTINVTPRDDIKTSKVKDTRVKFSEDKKYAISELTVFDNSFINYLNTKLSTFSFTKEGNAKLELHLNKDSISALSIAVLVTDPAAWKAYDATQLINFGNLYAQQFFPGYSIDEINIMLSATSRALGLSLEGIDWEKESVKKFLQNLKENPQELNVVSIIPELNEKVCVCIENTYGLFDVVNADNKTFKAIYLGEYNNVSDDPYIIITRGETTDENGEKLETIRVINEVVHLDMTFTEVK